MILMDSNVLKGYLDRTVCIQFLPSHAGQSQQTEGTLVDFCSSGILMEDDSGDEIFIPFAAIKMIRIKPKPTFWQKFTGAV